MAANETVQTARDEAGALATSVKDETKNVAHAATDQARSTLHEMQGDLRTRADEQARKVAQTLHTASRQLGSMADSASQQGDGFLPNVARESSGAIDRFATRLEDGGLDGMLADARSWARRNPGAFLLGAAALGFVAGRLARNASAMSNSTSNQPPRQSQPYPGAASPFPNGGTAATEGYEPTDTPLTRGMVQ